MSPVLTLGDGQNAGGDPSFTPRGRPSPGLSGWPNPQRTKITRIRRKHTNLDPCILPDSPSRSHNAMGRLWNRLLSHSVAPMLIADIGGITTAPPKSPCPSAQNRPASTTIRPQDPNRQLQSLTGPGSGAGLPQRQRYTPGHHTPSEKRGAKNTGLGTVRARAKELWPKTRPKRRPTCIKQKPEGWFIAPRPSPKLFRAGGGCTWACACTSCTPTWSSFLTCFTYLYDVSVGIHLN